MEEHIDQYLTLLRDLIRYNPDRLDLMDRYERLVGLPPAEQELDVRIGWSDEIQRMADNILNRRPPARGDQDEEVLHVPDEAVAEAAANLQEQEQRAWSEMAEAAEAALDYPPYAEGTSEVPPTGPVLKQEAAPAYGAPASRQGICPKCGHGYRSFQHRACREGQPAAPTDEQLDAIAEAPDHVADEGKMVADSPTAEEVQAYEAARAAVREETRTWAQTVEDSISRVVQVPDVLGPIMVDSDLPYSLDPVRYAPGDDCPKCRGRRQMRHDSDHTDPGPYCMACGFRPRRSPLVEQITSAEEGHRRRGNSHAGIPL